MDFETMLSNYIASAEAELFKYLPNPCENAVAEAMTYSVSAGGKRLRPVILLASAEAFERSEYALPFAAAIEFIHTYSLIHDDLPAMDDDDYRRGQLSCHKKLGEANAILAGDALLNLSFEIMLDLAGECEPVYTKRCLRAARVIANAAGINGMVKGQALDIFYQSRNVDEQALVSINENKTGALISAAFEVGAVLGGAEEKAAKAFAAAGMGIGKAFQIKDDILDSEGSFESLGKLTGSDEKNKKITYLTLLGREKCEKTIAELTEEAKELLCGTLANTEFLTKLITDLAGRSK